MIPVNEDLQAKVNARKITWAANRSTRDRDADVTVRRCRFCGGRAGEQGVTIQNGEHQGCPGLGRPVPAGAPPMVVPGA